MPDKHINIFQYIDFRKFLADFQADRCVKDKSFSKSGICRKLGLPNTRNYFRDIVSGRRSLTPAKIEMMLPVLELQPDEAQFFRILVQYNQTVIKDEKEFLFDQLISLNRTPKKFIDANTYAYYSGWHHSVIRGLLDIVNFKDNYGDLAKRIFPPVPLKEIKESIKLLKNLKLIKKNNHGYWKPSDKIISADSEQREYLLKKFQANCLENSLKTLFRKSGTPQNLSTETMSISSYAYKRIERKLQKFKSEVLSIIHKDEHPAEDVYQLIIHLFPHTN